MRLAVLRKYLIIQLMPNVLLLFNLFIMCYYQFCRRGQLGLGELEPKEEPVLIEALAGIKVCIATGISYRY